MRVSTIGGRIMINWSIKTFRTKEAMERFTTNNRIQWHEIFINNGYAVEYRKMRVIDIR